MSTYKERISEFRKLLNMTKGMVFFGGAGVSTESGIPDFRSKDGLYNKKDKKYEKYEPEYLLSHSCLVDNPDVFYSFFREKMDLRDYEPNRAHKALARMEERYGDRFLGVITQNIDGFHQKAGSQNVAEIHGTMSRCECDCNEYPGDYIFTHPGILRCPECCSYIRPAVTLYEESLPMEDLFNAQNWLNHAQLLIVGGTSLQVEPAASMVRRFFGKNIVIINQQPTILDGYADIVFRESIGQVLEDVVNY